MKTPEQKTNETSLVRPLPTNIDEMNIFQKIHAAAKELKSIAKNGRNDFQKYDYAAEADFVDACKPLFDKYGLIVVSQLISIETKELQKGSVLTTIQMKYYVCNVATKEELMYVIPGQGQDNGDKGVYKAMTGAAKYFMKKLFWLKTGDDPENDADEKKQTNRRAANKGTTPQPAPSANIDNF